MAKKDKKGPRLTEEEEEALKVFRPEYLKNVIWLDRLEVGFHAIEHNGIVQPCIQILVLIWQAASEVRENYDLAEPSDNTWLSSKWQIIESNSCFIKSTALDLTNVFARTWQDKMINHMSYGIYSCAYHKFRDENTHMDANKRDRDADRIASAAQKEFLTKLA